MIKLSEKIKKINIDGSLDFEVEMKNFTTFKTGGPADIFVRARSGQDVLKLRKFARENHVPLFVMGGGANILVADKGIRGITIYTGDLNTIETKDADIISYAGSTVDALSENALENNLSGLEFIYGMPGTVGGALWMNARCYGSEISQIFQWADIITPDNREERIYYNENEWSYKKSPFQKDGLFIVKACFSLKPGIREKIQEQMTYNKNDRENKGHYKAPCAGSIFKNNRDFGKPSGQIIDEVGLRGLKKGEAAVSDFHANIIINKGNATSSDIWDLINEVQKKVKVCTGFELEPEVIPVGDWR